MFLFMLAHQYALSLFRLIAALTRSIVMAYTLAWLIFLLHMLLGGFLLPKRKPQPPDKTTVCGHHCCCLHSRSNIPETFLMNDVVHRACLDNLVIGCVQGTC